MPRFILLDPSLREPGGHHFDYAYHTLQAAQTLGFDTALACQRRFRATASLPARCSVFPVFRHHGYSRYTDFVGVRNLLADERRQRLANRIADYCKSRLHERGREKRIESFARGCRQLCQLVDLRPGDQVLATTMSELDLLGLARFLSRHREIPPVDWHLQFHFNLFEGREPEYSAQADRAERIRRHFRRALSLPTAHGWHFYATSEILADQYNRLEVAPFEPLAYPINPVLRKPARQASSPIRVTCAGDSRAEKGFAQLCGILAELWENCFATRKAELVVQTRSTCEKHTPEIPAEYSKAVSFVPHPLEPNAYVELIRQAGIGLFLYDARRYYSRRAGVLGELLAAGTPVIVPAGCWLAEQIAEPIYEHQLEVGRRCETVGVADVSSAVWQQQDGLPGDPNAEVLEFGSASQAAVGELACPSGANRLLITFQWSPSAERGQYVQCEITLRDRKGNSSSRRTNVVGQWNRGAVPILVPIGEGTQVVEVRWTNAYHDSPVRIENVCCRFLAAAVDSPLGAVGLIAGNENEVGNMLREMMAHYPHYRATAQRFAPQWYGRHDPVVTVQQLVARAKANMARVA